jgi:oligopeptide transport system permease protein
VVNYIVKRVLTAFVTVLFIACVVFILMNLVPGGPFMSEKAPSPEVLEQLEKKYGLDKPLPEQLVTYLTDAVQGDFGVSFRMQKNRPVLTIIMEMFPTSAQVGAISLLLAVLFGVPIGCIAAYRQGTWVDSLLRVVTTLGIAVPGFVLATILLYIFGVELAILPTMGLSSPLHYIMPCFALSFYPMCYIGRLTRSSMLDVIHQEYVRTARAKGVAPVSLIFKHTLRNAVIPVITYLGPLTAYTLTGGFVVETVFSIPGLGRYFIQSITNRDYPIIMGTSIFLSALIVVMMLVVDIAYKLVDPRIQLSKGAE